MTAAFSTPIMSERLNAARAAGLDPEALIRAFRLMHTSRRIDDREILLKRQNKIYFQISCAGHEAIQVAAGMALRSGYDWFFPYYRDRALSLTLGMTPYDMLLQAVGAADDPSSGGRQMPSHWTDAARHIVSPSSATGTQFLPAVGCAEALQYLGSADRASEASPIVLASSGEGATSEGEFWESINQACLLRAPVVFLIQDNGFAISVPVEAQTPGASISKLLKGFPDLLTIEVDGTDFISSYRAMKTAAAYCREGGGPALVHAHCTRPYSHSLSDDERAYKTKQEREEEAERDPLRTFPAFLLEEGILDSATLERMTREIDRGILEDTQRALAAAPPAPETVLRHLYSETGDPTTSAFDVQALAPEDPPAEPRIMADLINLTLREEMRRNEKSSSSARMWPIAAAKVISWR